MWLCFIFHCVTTTRNAVLFWFIFQCVIKMKNVVAFVWLCVAVVTAGLVRCGNPWILPGTTGSEHCSATVQSECLALLPPLTVCVWRQSQVGSVIAWHLCHVSQSLHDGDLCCDLVFTWQWPVLWLTVFTWWWPVLWLTVFTWWWPVLWLTVFTWQWRFVTYTSYSLYMTMTSVLACMKATSVVTHLWVTATVIVMHNLCTPATSFVTRSLHEGNLLCD